MTTNPINRREFLRLFFLASGGVIITACRRGNSQPASATPTPAEVAEIAQPTCATSLDGNNAEVWAWNKRLAGTVTTVDDCSSLILLVNGVGIPVAASGLVDPIWAMLAMAASVTSIFVNALWGRPSLFFDAVLSVGRTSAPAPTEGSPG